MSRFSNHRRSQRRARSLSSASDVAAAASFTVESLELRRMLSAASSYDLQAHLVQQPTESDHAGFGQTVATNGNLALIGAPGVGVSFDYQGNPVVGSARLVDTSTGQTLRVFDDPEPLPQSGDAFGQSVAFVNGKIAIAEGANNFGGVGKVFVYDDANDLTPTVCITPTILNNNSSFATNMCAVGNDLFVTIAQFNGGPSHSAIARYNSSTGGLPTEIYFNPLTSGNDGFGSQLAVQGTNIYATAIGPNGPSIYKLDTTNGNITLFTDDNGGDSNFGFTLAASPTSLYVTTGGNQVLQLDTSANLVRTITPPPDDTGSVIGGFGESLAVGDEILVVGNREALEDFDQFIPGGEAYVYDLATGNYAASILNPTPVNPYLNEDPSAGEVDQFGWAVATLPGGKFLVTDPTDDTNEGTSPGGPYDTGSVYVYAPHVNAPVNQAPTASVSAPANAPENTTVTLDASASTDPDGPADITLYEWDLNNDGKFDDASGVTANFTQDLPGNYPVAIRVTDSAGHQSVASTSVQFTDVAPTANAGGNQSVSEGSALTLHGSGNSTSDTISSYAWDLDNNGSFETSGQNVSFNTDHPGSYTVNVRVTDDDGQTATNSATVSISDVAPTANAGGNQSATEGSSLTLHGSGNNTSGDAIVGYAWDLDNNGSFETSGQNPAFNTDLPGSYTVNLRVTDDDGQTATSSATVSISDVAPTANAGGNQTVSEGSFLGLHGTGNNTSGDAITGYAWDLDNNGSFETAGQDVNFDTDHPGSYTVKLRVTDDDGQTAVNTAVITVTDVAPTANAGGSQTTTTGTPVAFSGTGSSAPGDAITYQWDFDYDNNPAHFGIDASGANTSHTYAVAGTYTVALRVSDDDGQSTISTTTVTVNNPPPPPPTNHAPTGGAITGQNAAVRLQTVNFTGSYSDVDAGDTHQVTWNFGDGNVIAYHNTADSGALTPSHAFANAGSYTVTMTVKDGGGLTTSASFLVNVTATGVQGGTLYVGGTGLSDNVNITRNGNTNTVTVGNTTTNYNGTKVVVFMGDGNDILLIGNNVTLTVEAHGGAGNDILTGGGGPSILVGDAGSDLITGGGGRDVLIGGTGTDIITGNTDDDILIAGSTAFDNNSAALGSILSVWNGPGNYATRVNNLRAGNLTPDQDVFDDGAVDILSGGSGTDWFLFNNDQGVRDIVVDRVTQEQINDLDIVVT